MTCPISAAVQEVFDSGAIVTEHDLTADIRPHLAYFNVKHVDCAVEVLHACYGELADAENETEAKSALATLFLIGICVGRQTRA
jgi:hypothetical protein